MTLIRRVITSPAKAFNPNACTPEYKGLPRKQNTLLKPSFMYTRFSNDLRKETI